MKSLNEKTVNVKMKRIELCDLMLACTVIANANPNTTKWTKLHDKLEAQLSKFDEEINL